ncbi:MFS transporter [Alicyclobacillus ferrooxydans]|uniref:MFS transporter n=1 Tax=Alicyclobacillus ferrooxydans TaxID=471514 RepID=A0A0P9C9K0_9BACL|nr:MFS transporter [Alicyclobacillus ferrooxydans]KPV41802.1 MFS transporter [Alicyclobacillus ferrooxydans]
MNSTTQISASRPAAVNPWLVMTVTGLGVLLVMVNLGALNVALPAIALHFHAKAVIANWILLSYMLVNTILILIFGPLSDAFGRKQLYLLGMAVFTVVSLFVGLAPNIWWFIALRALQAAGGALIITNNTALITDSFPSEQLGQGLSVNVLISSVAQLVGPVIGGAVTARLGWEWVFWAGVPIGIVGVVWGYFVLRRVPSRASGGRVDWTGGALIFLALSGVIFSLSEGSTLGWGSAFVLIGFALFVVLMPIILWQQRRSVAPMIDFSLFGDRGYTMANFAAFLNAFARISVVLLFSLYLQSLAHLSVFWAGIAVLPVTIGLLLATPVTGALSNRISVRILSTVGLSVSAIGLALLIPGVSLHPNHLLNSLGMGLVGFGSGVFLTPNTRYIMTTVPPSRRGFANGLRSMLQNMGQVFSTAVSLTVVTALLPPRLQDVVYQGASGTVTSADVNLVNTAFRWAFGVLLIATVMGIVASALRGKKQR